MQRLSALALALIMAALAAPAAAQIAKPVYVSLPSAGNIQHLALTAAKYKGYYEEMGLADARVVYLRGNSINVQAIVAGSVQFASAFGPSMHAMFRGEQLRVLVQIFNQIPMSLITRPEVKRLEDLRGQKIAVTFGGSTYSVLLAMLGHFGLPQNFGEYLNMPGDQTKAAALMQGTVAAALMAPPADGPVLKAGFKRLVYLGDVFKGVPFSAMLTTAKVIQEEPDLVERTVKAVVKAMLYIKSDRDGGIQLIMKHGQVDKETAAPLYDLVRDAYAPSLSADGIMKRAELEIATLKERPNFDPNKFMDDRFLKKALAALEPGSR
ncbi:MAG TPA: ABC transporter substrate-binding protein [Candidatus Binatia bacterium]